MTEAGEITFALAEDRWQMAPGERAALEGLLSQAKPRLAIEIGTAQGGSLARIALHSDEVHTFDLQPAVESPPPNATFHRGDNHVLLPQFLAKLAAEGRNVDFAFVDGDHRAEGVRKDVEDLLGSPAVGQTCILLHDTMNEEVREGIDAIDLDAYPGIRYVDFAFTQLYQSGCSPLEERWGGLGLIIVDRAGSGEGRRGVVPRSLSGRMQLREIIWRLLVPARRVKRAVKHRGGALLARVGLR